MTKNKLSFQKRVDLYYGEYDNYLLGLLKEAIPRQLSKLYENDLILKGESLRQYIGSITDVFNLHFEFNDIRKDVEEVLKNKYNLVIKNDTPLIMEYYK